MSPLRPNLPCSFYTELIAAFQRRFDQLEMLGRSDILTTCGELQEFLPRAIAFLNAGDNVRFAEDVAHYLMGKVDYLPSGMDELDPPRRPIPANVRETLSDLLRTHRFKLNCNKESPTKTVEKLHALLTRINRKDLLTRLRAWLDAAPSEERNARQSASHKIREILSENVVRPALTLENLLLTTVPPLPEGFSDLNLSGNKFTSLEGMPRQMNSLRCLTIRNSPSLTSLAGLPDEMKGLQSLNLSLNPVLISLVGMPQDTPFLLKVELTDNPLLSSLDGLPQSVLADSCVRIFLKNSPLVKSALTADLRNSYRASLEFDLYQSEIDARMYKLSRQNEFKRQVETEPYTSVYLSDLGGAGGGGA
jgi:hypothetical protein